MVQISNQLFCKKEVFNLNFPVDKILPSPYFEYPFLIIDNFLSQNECEFIYQEIIKDSEFESAKVKILKDNLILPKLNQNVRKTNLHNLTNQSKLIYKEAFFKIKNKIEKFFNLILLQSSGIQALGYEKGAYYLKHSDNCSELIDKNKNLIGFRSVANERKITTVSFLNSNFNGGELIFNFLFDKRMEVFTFKPKTGTLIAFASNPIFTHEVKEVLNGYRVSLVEWHNALI